jgi:hypothetical protein
MILGSVVRSEPIAFSDSCGGTDEPLTCGRGAGCAWALASDATMTFGSGLFAEGGG